VPVVKFMTAALVVRGSGLITRQNATAIWRDALGWDHATVQRPQPVIMGWW
jgi:hypothetical protein